MPWTAADASHKTKKADTPKEKRQWRDIANDALKRGVSKGTAIKMASGVIKKEEAKRKLTAGIDLSREPLLIEGHGSLFDLVFEKLDYGRWEQIKKQRAEKTRKPSLLSRVRRGLKSGASAAASAAQQSMAVR